MKMQQKVQSLLKKAGAYKYAALILLLGIALMLIPQEKKETEQPVERSTVHEPDTLSTEEKLQKILSRMDGVGEVEVMLTLEAGTAYQYQTDEQTHVQQEETEVQKETVLVSDGAGGQKPITVKTTYPIYQGALILCQGADSAAVRLDIINAVSDLTGLSSDKISVIKMKGN